MEFLKPREEPQEFEIPYEEGSVLPGHVQRAIDKNDAEVTGLQHHQKTLAGNLDAKGLKGEAKNRLLVPVIGEKLKYQRRAEQIRSEFGEPSKYPIERQKLKAG